MTVFNELIFTYFIKNEYFLMGNLIFVFLFAGVFLLFLSGLSLYLGKTIGLYGTIEDQSSIFYWIIITTYLALGFGSLFSAYRFFLRQ